MRKENKLRHFSTNYENAGCFIERTLHTRLEKSVQFNDVILFSARVQVYRIESKKKENKFIQSSTNQCNTACFIQKNIANQTGKSNVPLQMVYGKILATAKYMART